MPLLIVVPLGPIVARAAAPRALSGATLTVDHAEILKTVALPANIVIIRGSAPLTVLTATALAGKVLTISGPADGYADAAIIVGDGIAPEPTGSGAVQGLVVLGSVGQGPLALPSLHDAAAPSPSVYLSLDQLDTNSAPYIVRKDASGNLNIITDAPPS